jgi:hypothetical protein
MRSLRVSNLPPPSSLILTLVLSLPTAVGCTNYDQPTVPIVPVGPPMMGLHVVGSHIENSAGQTVVLRGVNRSGTEYRCVQGGGIFDGGWGVATIAAMATWKVNAVRIPLNEGCWLGINGLPDGKAYKDAIRLFVDMLQQFNIVPIVELHWVGPGTALPDRQQPLPDADHAVDFWTDVAATFADNDGVVFELYNEPFPDNNRDTPAAWDCWQNGCIANQAVPMGQPETTYQSVGMSALVAAIRPIAPRHLILLGGVQYSNSLSQWMARAPADSNLAAAWHVYNFNPCKDTTCYDDAPAALAATVPIVATELGQRDCMGGFIETLMAWLDARGLGYLAWSWNAGTCQPYVSPSVPGQPWPLVTDYGSGTPSGPYAQAFRDHLAGVVAPPP